MRIEFACEIVVLHFSSFICRLQFALYRLHGKCFEYDETLNGPVPCFKVAIKGNMFRQFSSLMDPDLRASLILRTFVLIT